VLALSQETGQVGIVEQREEIVYVQQRAICKEGDQQLMGEGREPFV
jgi:hypothetical protein